MKKMIFSIPVIAAFAITANAQSIGPATLNATGGTAVIGANEFDWSVGEMVMVNTFSTSSVVVTQGVLQPAASSTTRVDETDWPARLSVYPNPASSVVNIHCASVQPSSFTYKLMDMTGKTLLTGKSTAKNGKPEEQLNIATLACATYMLAITVNTEHETKTITYKIEKLN